MHPLQPLVDASAVLAMEQQLHLADVVGERDFTASLDTGTISFGEDLTCRCELIGTEAPESGTWLWGWANPAGFEDYITATTRALRDHGEAQGIAALSRAEVPLDDEVSGHRAMNGQVRVALDELGRIAELTGGAGGGGAGGGAPDGGAAGDARRVARTRRLPGAGCSAACAAADRSASAGPVFTRHTEPPGEAVGGARGRDYQR